MLFCRGTILLAIYAYKGEGVAERRHDDKGEGEGEGGGLDTPKSDDVIYEQPLTEAYLITVCIRNLEIFELRKMEKIH